MHDPMRIIGEGIGSAFRASAQKRAIERLTKRIRCKKLLAHIGWQSYEDSGEYTDVLTVAEIGQQIFESRWAPSPRELDTVDTLGKLQEVYYETVHSGGAHLISLLTVKQSQKQKREKERKNLETSAAQFARKCGHKVDSIKFIQAVRREIRRIERDRDLWNSSEVRMEEWAACRHNGVGSDVYFDDLNFENGRFHERLSKLRAILKWLERECPLLVAKFNERFRKRNLGSH